MAPAAAVLNLGLFGPQIEICHQTFSQLHPLAAHPSRRCLFESSPSIKPTTTKRKEHANEIKHETKREDCKEVRRSCWAEQLNLLQLQLAPPIVVRLAGWLF